MVIPLMLRSALDAGTVVTNRMPKLLCGGEMIPEHCAFVCEAEVSPA